MAPPAGGADYDGVPLAEPEGGAYAEEVMITGSSDEMRMDTSKPVAKQAPVSPPAPPPVGRPAPDTAATTPSRSTAGGVPGNERGPAPASAAEAVAVRAPMLIYTAGISLTVTEIKTSLMSIEALTRELGGFLARRDNVSITVRVPVARFDEAVRRIEALGEVIHRKVTVDDVTEEFTDLEVRLKNLRAVRARLEKLLEKAKGVEEAVLLERELGRVAGEIDRIEGRMKLLRDRASYSTITVSLRERRREAIGPRGPRLPVDWLERLGLGRLLQL
jgi:hypothetical protein